MQNPDDIYGAIEAQEDFILIKRLNRHHIPIKLSWLVNEITAKLRWAASHYILHMVGLVSIDHLNRNSFYCVWPEGRFTLEHNSMPRFRHHRTNDNALKLAGLTLTPVKTESGKGKSAEQQITEIQEKRKQEEQYVGRLVRAFEIYKLNKSRNPAYSWTDCAADPDVKFLTAEGKPSADGLRIAIGRYAKAGRIPGYPEWRAQQKR